MCLRLSSFCCPALSPSSLLRGKFCFHWIFTHVANIFLVEWQVLRLWWGNDNCKRSKMCPPHNKNEKINEKRKAQTNPVGKGNSLWFMVVCFCVPMHWVGSSSSPVRRETACWLFSCVFFSTASQRQQQSVLFSKNSSIIIPMESWSPRNTQCRMCCHSNDENGLIVATMMGINWIKWKTNNGKFAVWDANSTTVAAILMISLVRNHGDACHQWFCSVEPQKCTTMMGMEWFKWNKKKCEWAVWDGHCDNSRIRENKETHGMLVQTLLSWQWLKSVGHGAVLLALFLLLWLSQTNNLLSLQQHACTASENHCEVGSPHPTRILPQHWWGRVIFHASNSEWTMVRIWDWRMEFGPVWRKMWGCLSSSCLFGSKS